jgi:hypothetical protein
MPGCVWRKEVMPEASIDQFQIPGMGFNYGIILRASVE